MSAAVCLHWGANFLVSQTFPVMLPETRRRSLEEIEAALQRKSGATRRRPAAPGR
jgi:hypothetical protein